jgi:hypothetical protein
MLPDDDVPSTVTIGILQRSLPLHPETITALQDVPCQSIIVDASPESVVRPSAKMTLVHQPDPEGFFPIALLIPLFDAFLATTSSHLLLLEGDMVPTAVTIAQARACTTNTKAFYKESEPNSPHAYVRREGLAGVLMRSEIQRIHAWMRAQPLSRFRAYQGYCDTFLWFAVSSESTGYSVSTAGPDWIPIVHMTHDDATRVTKLQRRDMKQYRRRLAAVIAMALECCDG